MELSHWRRQCLKLAIWLVEGVWLWRTLVAQWTELRQHCKVRIRCYIRKIATMVQTFFFFEWRFLGATVVVAKILWCVLQDLSIISATRPTFHTYPFIVLHESNYHYCYPKCMVMSSSRWLATNQFAPTVCTKSSHIRATRMSICLWRIDWWRDD